MKNTDKDISNIHRFFKKDIKNNSNSFKKFDYKSVIIFGAGPVGLWSALKMLENNFAENVLLAEKRFKFDSCSDDWAKRSMVVQFHRSILNLPRNSQLSKLCPFGVIYDQVEKNRKKYQDLDHMAIKNIQLTLRDHLEQKYKDRFMMIGLSELERKNNIPTATLELGANSLNLFNGNFKPEFILDATGFSSSLMNKVLEVKFEEATEYGHALKITWPEHQLSNTLTKEIEFHDCHPMSPSYSEGNSSLAEFSEPVCEAMSFLSECGYNFISNAKPTPFLEADQTEFSIKLSPFIKKIISSKQDKKFFDKAKNLFITMRAGKLEGVNGYNFVICLQEFNCKEAETLAFTIRRIVNKSLSKEDTFLNLDQDKQDLTKVRIVFVPSRVERWLSVNKIESDFDFVLTNSFGNEQIQHHKIIACAAGDSLTNTDFRHGLGINRGIHTATRLFEQKLDPEFVRTELVKNSYYELHDVNDNAIFNRAIACRDWLLDSNKNKNKLTPFKYI